MQEVQHLCDRVLIINKGNIVANDPVEQLQQRISGEMVVTVEFREGTTKEKLRSIRNVKRVTESGRNRFLLCSNASNDIRQDIFRFAVDNNLTLLEMHKEVLSMEDVFQQLTQQKS
jgi:ABC-2 type transport system ATP-binding protein